MSANTAVIPLKAIYTGSDVTALGELNTGDKLDPTFIDLSDYIAVANVSSTYATISTVNSNLANTNTWINSNLANTNAYIASEVSGLWSGITGTNTAIRTLVSDRLQVANAASTYATISTVSSNLANTNAYIAYVAANAGEVSNAYLTSTFTTNTAFQSALANTNAYIASISQNAISEYQSNTTTYTAEVVDTFDKTAYRSGKYQVQITNSDGYHACELMVLHNGTTAYLSQYADVVASTYDSLGSFDADVSGNNVRIKFTPNASISAESNVKFKRQLITISDTLFATSNTDFQVGSGLVDLEQGFGSVDWGSA